MTLRNFLSCAIAALFCSMLVGCAGMTAAEVGTVTTATVGGVAMLIKSWSDAGLIPPEKAAQWTATAAGIDNTVQASLTAAQMLGESIAQIKAQVQQQVTVLTGAVDAAQARADDSFSKTEAVGLAASAATAGGVGVNMARNMARAKRGEPVGKKA